VESVKHSQNTTVAKPVDVRKTQELEREIRDLKITNRAKDMFIEQLKDERGSFFEKLLSANQTVGELKTKLHQLDGPKL
jgi:hypothetical protein